LNYLFSVFIYNLKNCRVEFENKQKCMQHLFKKRYLFNA